MGSSDERRSENVEPFDWTFGIPKPDFRLAAAILDRWADDNDEPPLPGTGRRPSDGE